MNFLNRSRQNLFISKEGVLEGIYKNIYDLLVTNLLVYQLFKFKNVTYKFTLSLLKKDCYLKKDRKSIVRNFLKTLSDFWK